MGLEAQNLHIFIFPVMSGGHLLPAIDIAKLIAAEGVRVSILVTAGNTLGVEAAIQPAVEAGHIIRTLLVEGFSAHGLPDDASKVSSWDKQIDVLVNTDTLRPSFERLIAEHRPAAVISDTFLPWTAEVTAELGIPRLVFHGTSFFSLCISGKLYSSPSCWEHQQDGGDRFIVPGIPHRIELIRSQVYEPKKMRKDLGDLFAGMAEADKKSHGTVVNSFYELEPEYAEHFLQANGKKAWHIGPVQHVDDDAIASALRSGKDDDDLASLLGWLDSKAVGSVLYVCFGSLVHHTEIQLREIAAGLESSGHPFIWVVRNNGRGIDATKWLPTGFAERTADTGVGMIIQGWASQVLMLNHRAVGGFLTHCGWNSSLESISAGVPVVSWPMFADQFFNERLLVDVLRVGVEISVKTSSLKEEERDLVKSENIAVAVDRLMGDNPKAKEMRETAKELKALARKAVKMGGSSRRDLHRLVQDLLEMKPASILVEN